LRPSRCPAGHHQPDRHCCRRTQCSPCTCWRPARALRPRLCTSGVPVEWLTGCPPPEPSVLGAAVGLGRFLSRPARPLTVLPAHSAKVRPCGGKNEQRTHLFAGTSCLCSVRAAARVLGLGASMGKYGAPGMVGMPHKAATRLSPGPGTCWV
jgi:hypothetical protein